MDMSFKFDTEYVAYSYAGIWKRALGRLIDIGLVYIISTLAVQAIMNAYLAVFFVLLDYVYTAACIYCTGQTLGLWIVRAKVVSTKYRRISLWQVLLRTICSKLSSMVICLGNLWILFNDSSQTWHDMLAETIVLNKPYALEVENFIEKKPWESRKFIGIARVLALFLSLNIIFYTSLDNLINSYGKVGLVKTKSFSYGKDILDLKNIKGDENGIEQLVVLNKIGYKYSLDIFSPEENVFSERNSRAIDDIFQDKITYEDFTMDDIDDNKVNELILTRSYIENQNQVRELIVYKLEGSTYKPLAMHKKQSKVIEEIPTTCTAYTDDKGKHKLLWCDVSEVSVLTFNGKELQEEYTSYFGTINSVIVMADFTGVGKKIPYVVQQYNTDIEVNALEFTSRMHLDSLGKIKDYLSSVKNIQSQKIRVGDVNNDGKDELMLIDEDNGLKDRKLLEKKQSAWLNIYSYNKNSWSKVWIGGNIASKNKDKFKETIDINCDGKLETVMVNSSNINIYKLNAALFKLNTIWLKEYKIVDGILH